MSSSYGPSRSGEAPPVDRYLPEYSARRRSPPRADRNMPSSDRSSGSSVFQFGAPDNYRPPARDSQRYRPSNGYRGEGPPADGRNARDGRREDFSFRTGPQDVRFPPQDQSSGRPQRSERAPGSRSYNAGGRGRGGGFRRGAHDRPLLRSGRGSTPEQMAGMGEALSRFRDADDVSLSDEEDMDIEPDDMNALSEGECQEQPAAKKARVESESDTTGQSVPKWSNPDPYTALPPPDESQTKKKDVVKLIRKAKVAPQNQEAKATRVADGADFISLNFDDDLSELSASTPSESEAAPPPKFSHKTNLHSAASSDAAARTAPGTATAVLTSASLGPPPASAPKGPAAAFVTSASLSAPPASAPKGPANAKPTFNGNVVGGSQQTKYMADNIPSMLPMVSQTLDTLKRKFPDDADLLPPPPKSRKRKRDGKDLDGSVLAEWTSSNQKVCTPWCVVDHSLTENVGFWLHKEICDFYEYVKPLDSEQALRDDIIRRMTQFTYRKYPRTRIDAFGSFAAGLYLPTADMDLVLTSERFRQYGHPELQSNLKWMRKFGNELANDGFVQPGSLEVIAQAKVPIIKFVDRVTGLKVDLSFENMTGVAANHTFREWKAQYPAMPVIVTLVKQFLLMRGLSEVFTGGLGGFTVTCLVVSLLQHMPAVHSGNMKSEHNLGEILLNFFDLYGNKFRMFNTGISVRPPGYFRKQLVSAKLSIIDPNRRENDISKGSNQAPLVFRAFSEAHASLQQRMADLHHAGIAERRGGSILGSILAGDYSSFDWQRDRLRRIFVQTTAAPVPHERNSSHQ